MTRSRSWPLAVVAGLALLLVSCVTASLLPDGRVLLVGPTTAHIYDPVAKTLTATGGPTGGRFFNSWTALRDGGVLAAGGVLTGQTGDSPVLTSAEVYDPATGAFEATGSMTQGRVMHTAVLLADGRVLIAGGVAQFAVTGFGGEEEEEQPPLTSVEIWDPTTGQFAAAGSLLHGRGFNTATPLTDGRVLFVGGSGANDTVIAQAELYDPASGTSVETGDPQARTGHTATLLSDGRVLIAGGASAEISMSGTDAPPPLATSALFDVGSGSFTEGPPLAGPRLLHAAVRLPDGRVLLLGGMVNGQTPATAVEAYDPASNTFSAIGQLPVPYFLHTAIVLSDSRVMLVGLVSGSDTSDLPLIAGVFDPGTGTYESVIAPPAPPAG